MHKHANIAMLMGVQGYIDTSQLVISEKTLDGSGTVLRAFTNLVGPIHKSRLGAHPLC